MPSNYLKKMLEEASDSTKVFAEKSLDIVEQIHEILQQKGMTQKDLADALDKTESEISKWLSPGHNMTLKTIAKIESILEEPILMTPKRMQEKSVILLEREDQLSLVKEPINHSKYQNP